MTVPTSVRWNPGPGPASAGTPHRSPARPWLSSLIVLSLIAVFLAFRGHVVAAVIALAAGLLITQATITSPTFRRALPRAQHRVAHAVGLFLAVALLLPVYYLVITPFALVMRVFGVSSLGPPRVAPGDDAWHERQDQGRERPQRSFADQRAWSPSGSGPRRDLVIRTVAAVLVLELLAYGAYRLYDDWRNPDPTSTGVAAPGALESAALRDLEWAPEAMAETGEVGRGGVYTPLTGYSVRDYEGEYVNVSNRARRSYVPDLGPGDDPLDVWFFGGSTMFGFDLQRDAHTIPSEVVRLAEDDGVLVRARNYGAPGFTNFQETVLLAQLLTAGERPDLVVFYDGINDSSLQLTNAVGHLDVPAEPGQLNSQAIRHALADSGLVPDPAYGPPAPLTPDDQPSLPISADELVEATVDTYAQGVELSQALAEAYGFEVVHYWQPDLYSKQPLDPGEEALLDGLALDRYRFEAMAGLGAHIRAALPGGTIDISDALDEVEGPVLADYVHINERGGRAVAEAMYETLAARLEGLSQG